jgi:Glycosyl transferase family 2
MCTFNGAVYLLAQLESLVGQTHLPDELVVCDDCSTDETAELLRAFAAHAPFPVRLYVNERNQGSTKNFEQAIGRCTGDVIALCDQDDVWLPEKLERMAAALAAAPHAGLVFSDAEVVDERLRPLGQRLWQCFKFGPPEQELFRRGRAFDVLFRRNVVTGTTMAFRAEFKELVLPLPALGSVIHDAAIALMIAAIADLVFIPEPLMLYRQHAGQQIGPRLPAEPVGAWITTAFHTDAHAYTHVAAQFKAIHARLSAYDGPAPRAEAMRPLTARIAHLEARANMPRRRRLRRVPAVLKELLARRYHQHSNGLVSAAKDLLF